MFRPAAGLQCGWITLDRRLVSFDAKVRGFDCESLFQDRLLFFRDRIMVSLAEDFAIGRRELPRFIGLHGVHDFVVDIEALLAGAAHAAINRLARWDAIDRRPFQDLDLGGAAEVAPHFGASVAGIDGAGLEGCDRGTFSGGGAGALVSLANFSAAATLASRSLIWPSFFELSAMASFN